MRINVHSDAATFSPASLAIVKQIRATHAPFPVLVGGSSAYFYDLQASLRNRLPLAVAIIVACTLVLLFLATGSVILPFKAILMNLLTLSVAFGVLVIVFQWGFGHSLLDFSTPGSLEQTQPVLLFAIVFGLSTDYGVFLLTRIKEVHETGASNREAVAAGMERTGRIVTAAALLLSLAIGAFATSQIVFIKELGVGIVAGVLIDATIVRGLLVPSLMALLGDWNWWAPRPLRRLYRAIS
jgi:RND superfamily putative drug exporter